MARIQNTLNIAVQNKWLMLKNAWELLAKLLNGGLGFGNGITPDNFNNAWANVATPGAINTDFTITHNLKRIPVGYLVTMKNAACDVYTGSVAATATQLTLRATVAGVSLRLMIF